VAEPGFGDDRGGVWYVAAPPEGSGVGIAEGGDHGLGSSVEDATAQGTGSGIDDCCAEELGSVAGGAHDLGGGFDDGVAQGRSRGAGDAGVGYKKRYAAVQRLFGILVFSMLTMIASPQFVCPMLFAMIRPKKIVLFPPLASLNPLFFCMRGV
jgi:hypothetical protein